MPKPKSIYRAFFFAFVIVLSLGLSSSCSQDSGGSTRVKVLTSTGSNCDFGLRTAQLSTLTSFRDMQGSIGGIVYSKDELDFGTELRVEPPSGFRIPRGDFSKSGGVYTPLDKTSLFNVSFYHAVQQAYLTTRELLPGFDMNDLVSDLSETRLVHSAFLLNKNGDPRINNATYVFSIPSDNGGDLTLARNFLVAFPTGEDQELPVVVNNGAIAHEFFHFVARYLYRNAIGSKNSTRETKKYLAAMEEGLADYIGFLSMDHGIPGGRSPKYIDCSLPVADRDMAVPKSLKDQTELIENSGDVSVADFPPHIGGAAYANVLYEIGAQIGHETFGKVVMEMVRDLATCIADGTNAVEVSFESSQECLLNTPTARGNTRTRSVIEAVFENSLTLSRVERGGGS